MNAPPMEPVPDRRPSPPLSIFPGQVITIGWNGAKYFGSDRLAFEEARVEAVGIDWVVMRDFLGRAHAATFPSELTHSDIIAELQE